MYNKGIKEVLFMFSVGDIVYSKSLGCTGVVEKVSDDIITVRFKELFSSIGVLREDLNILEKTKNETELLKTKQQNKNDNSFSIDCDYDKLFTEASLSLTKFVQKLNNYRNKWTEELSYSWVKKLLIKNGYLYYNEYDTLVPTEKGMLIGIERKAYYANNTYQHANFYDLCAQERVLKLILDNKK